MKNLWAPWRMAYIEKPDEEPSPGDDPCIFCRFPKQSDDQKNLILHRSGSVFVIMNRFPYSNGHLMIVPYVHQSAFEALEPAVRAELFDVTARMVALLKETFSPEGLNVGMNLGRAAGAGIADHLHVHVVPRWIGDSNFMPVLADTKVISEHLEATYARLAAKL